MSARRRAAGDEQRIIDLSRGAGEKLGIVRARVARVELRVAPGQ